MGAGTTAAAGTAITVGIAITAGIGTTGITAIGTAADCSLTGMVETGSRFAGLFFYPPAQGRASC
jgi:D-serine deaminase-like pyridoxal phosphate-dependent protein